MQNTSFLEEHEETLKILTESDSKFVTLEELKEFMRELLKAQVVFLQERNDAEKYQRCVNG